MSTTTRTPTPPRLSSPRLLNSTPRPLQACDACKSRKIRCIRSDLTSSSSDGRLAACDSCKRRSKPCTTDHVPKKRGPAPRPHARHSRAREGFRAIAARPGKEGEPEVRRRTASPVQAFLDTAYAAGSGPLDQMDNGLMDVLPQLGELEDGSHQNVNGVDVNGFIPDMLGQSETREDTPNPLTSLLPRSLLEHAISVYFKYVFGLVPIVHRPTFLADFHSHRETRPGEEEWTALVISVVGLTLAQVPWAFSDMNKSEIRTMVQKCYNRSKAFMFADFDQPTIGRCILLYIGVIMATRLGYWGSREICLGANWSLIYKMRLHEESSYALVNPIEAEIRRRLYWLALGFDKAASAVRGAPPMITREHCANVRLPTAIDDEFLTPEGYSMPSHGQTSLLSGFRYISRLYGLFGQVLDMRRLDQLQQPSGIALQMRLTEVDELYEQMMNVMAGCPEELRLQETPNGELTAALDWAGDVLAGIQALFETDVPQTLIADSFLVQQANIFTAIQMARQLTLRYRADLRMLRKAEVQSRYSRVSLISELSPSAPMILSEGEATLEEETERTAADLLRILKIIPIEVLAVNGDAVVNKVRFVALSQLDALEKLAGATDDNGQAVGPGAEKVKSAQNYLFNFLQILADIEAMFSLTDGQNFLGPDQIVP